MVSDNAFIFKSEEFATFYRNFGIFQKFIAPGHSSTNGLAMSDDPSLMTSKVLDILFRYRTTPLKKGKSPSEQYLERQIKIQSNALKTR